jgi:hypothetical protein
MKSEARTVEEYLAELPSERSQALSIVRQIILDNLDSGFNETMNFGMISYEIPLDVYPTTYNGQPLMYAALASQKNYMAVYLNCIYSDTDAAGSFKEKYQATGKRYDVGKSCVRFRKLENLPLELIGEYVASHDVKSWIALYEEVMNKADGRKRKKQ